MKMKNTTYKNKKCVVMLISFALSSTLSACAMPKPAPEWPTGKERPINHAPEIVDTKAIKK